MSRSKSERYIADVLAGRVITSKLVRRAIERHQRDLDTGAERGLYFDPACGQHIIEFIERFCSHSQGEWAGQPFILEPWQCAMLYVLYGWRESGTGYRRFRFAYVSLARGNGKSQTAAAIALYELISEPDAEIYSVATKKEQARIVYAEAERMVRKLPPLRARLKNYRDSLFIPGTASKFQPLASDTHSLDGLRPQAISCDEVHAWPGIQGRQLWDVLATALGKRRSPLMFAITTAGSDRNSVCWSHHEYSEKVLSGIILDDRWFAWICQLDPEDDYCDERTWIKANPNLGVTVKIDELRAAVEKAKVDPASLNGVLRLRLNIWTQSHTAWMPLDRWAACSDLVDPEALKGRPCFGGLDLSTTIDISSLVLLFPPYGEDTKWRLLPFFFLPADNIEARVKKDHAPYDVWARQGLFTLTEGNVIDYDVIRAKVKELAEIYDIREIALDRWNAQQICTQLEGDGLTMVQFGQGYSSMSAPTKRLMELVLEGSLAHGGNPVLRWPETLWSRPIRQGT